MWGRSDYHPANIDWSNFESYESALKFHDNVKPIRGCKPEIRPIGGNRRYKHCLIQKTESGVIECVLYGTKCVEYHPDGHVRLRIGNWVTPSTAKFIDAVLPYKFGLVRLDKGRIILSQKIGENNLQFEIPQGDEGLLLKTDDNWQTINPVGLPTQYNYVASRKALNKVRARFKGFIDYLRVSASMSCVYSSDEYIELFPEVAREFVSVCMTYPGHHHTHPWALSHYMQNAISNSVPKLAGVENDAEGWRRINLFLNMAASDDATEWRKLTLLLVQRHWVNHTHNRTGSIHDLLSIFVGDEYAPTPVVNWMDSVHGLVDAFDMILKIAYADVCFTQVEVEHGHIPSKNNKFYVDTHQKFKDNLTSRQYVHI